jgi:phosphate starvation-inducible PhoH-like protein
VTARAQKGRSPSTSHPGVEEEAEIILTFDDNRLASLVFGQYDQNLAHLERRLNVAAVANGNRVTLKGTPESTEMARRVLEGLYDRARQGAAIGPGDVDGTVEEGPLRLRPYRDPQTRPRARPQRGAERLYQGAQAE